MEQTIQGILEEKGYEEIEKHLFFAFCQVAEQPIFAHQVHIGQNIYGKKRTCGFIAYHPERHPNCLVIESKWQASSGSVDEKYPFLVFSIQQSGYDSIIVLDGGGYSSGAENWLKEQTASYGGSVGSESRIEESASTNCLKDVLDIRGFRNWSNRYL